MRRLWIRRHKAGRGNVEVYIEDPEMGDVILQDTCCRKLADLGNDQQKHLTISQAAAKLFVLAGDEKIAVRELPEGTDDVFLSGKMHKGGFLFDDEEEEPEAPAEKRGIRWGIVALVAALLLGVGAGAIVGPTLVKGILSAREAVPAEKTFACQELSITLTDRFEETDAAGYTACFSSGDNAVFVLREDFSAREGFGDLTLAEYGAMVLRNNGLTETVELGEYGGLTAFHHISGTTEPRFYYYTVLLKGSNAFWMVQITALAEGAEMNMSTYHQWAKSIALAE